MTKHLTSLLLSACLLSNALADDRTVRAHTPPQSPFHAHGNETLAAPDWDVEYEGRATISVTYRFVFDEESSFEQNPHLYFEPSPESQSQLPYLTRWVHESENSPKLIQWTDPAKEIWVTNVAEAAVALLGKSLAGELMAGKHEKVAGEALVVIEGLSAGYTCDSPFFTTRFVEVSREISAAVTGERGVTGC